MSSTIIDDIRNNAHSLCENRRPVYLLSVDVDQEYSSGLSQEFLTATQNFMDTIRPHAQIIHIWHKIFFDGKTRDYNRDKKIASYSPENHDALFPDIQIHAPDWVMGKKYFSALKEPALAQILSPHGIVIVTGTLGSECVKKTIKTGRTLPFDIVAAPDLIEAPETYEGAYSASSHEIVEALSALENQELFA
jgi:nicotinamidase-related amidase